MDNHKKSGFLLSEFENSYYNFVYDVQHAYEHDTSLQYAKKLFDIMHKKIKHLHVSGMSAKTSHSLLYKADNKKEILKILKNFENPLIVFEGELSQNYEEEIGLEISLLKSR